MRALPILLLALTAAATGADKVTPKTVAIDGTTYQPSTLTVKVGESVTWQNKDPFPHTVTSKDAGFDSQSIASIVPTVIRRLGWPDVSASPPLAPGLLERRRRPAEGDGRPRTR